ncbi:hypothetical protein SKAU_G00047910 [Synaphobranchus kaupii]|uniref:Uncharacterized protein n=1 Tax=Synaphobranchus kaupii TaxID=118154 RepID=A0A9Q1G398_SYNKA|nr:hypothetical protein SKAU_G00047910 [Synaphobranchus kaupii]
MTSPLQTLRMLGNGVRSGAQCSWNKAGMCTVILRKTRIPSSISLLTEPLTSLRSDNSGLCRTGGDTRTSRVPSALLPNNPLVRRL